MIPSLLKLFYIFQLNLFYDKHDEVVNVFYAIAIMYSNCNKDTGLCLKDTPVEKMITKFVLNAI